MFVIPNPVAPQGIPEETEFRTKTKGEVGDIRWFSLKDTFMPTKFFTVRPFIRDVRRWVPKFREQQASYIQEWQKKQRTIQGNDMGIKTKDSREVNLEVKKRVSVATTHPVESVTKVQTLRVNKNGELSELEVEVNKFKIETTRSEETVRKARPKSRGV